MTLGRAVKAGAVPIRYDALLNIIEIRRHQSHPPHGRSLENFPEGEDRCAGRDAGAVLDAPAELFIALEAEPTGGRAAPGDDMHSSIGEKLPGARDFGMLELLQPRRGEA